MLPFILFIIIFIVILAFGTALISIIQDKRIWNILGKVLIVLGLLVMIGFAIYIAVGASRKTSSEGESSPANGFVIDSYKVILDVGEDESIQVTENIGIQFTEEGHHGIYHFVPEWLEYTNKENVTTSRKANLYDLRALEEDYSIDTVKGKKRIRIGSASYYVPTGLHEYIIMYNYDLGPDPYKGYDEFIFHAFGDYWGTRIKNPEIEINLPKEIDENTNMHFYADKKRSIDITSEVNVKIEGKKVLLKLNPNYFLRKSLTIDIELPEGYFTKSGSTYGLICFFICFFIILFAIFTAFLWFRYGKDLPKVPETVEFYPPEGLDAAEIGYLHKGDTGKKLAIALIIELAGKGIIKIDEGDYYKPIIKKVNTTDVNIAINRKITVKKLKEYKKSIFESHFDSYFLMKSLFPTKETTETVVNSDYDTFDKHSPYLIEKGYIEVVNDTLKDYKQVAIDQIKKNLKDKEFEGLKFSGNERTVYDYLFTEKDEVDLSKHKSFYTVYSAISNNLNSRFKDRIYDTESDKMMFFTSLGFLISTILLGVAYCFIKDLNPSLSYLYTLALIAILAIAFFAIIMTRKTSYGEQIKSKIKSFKRFLEMAEKDKLNALVVENPNYFYDILPYAYVLGISKKWIEKFENIPEPDHDMGNFNYTDINSINTLSSSVYTPSSNSSGGCSSCGGGCSSCGGGCSSCGGGGSW